MGTIADYTDNELWLLRPTLRERYSKDVAVQLADTGMRLHLHPTQLHTCPAESRRIRDMDAGLRRRDEAIKRSQKTYESQDTDRRE